MTNPTLSQAWKEAAASAPAGEIIYHTLEFRHASFTSPIRVVQDHQDLSAKLEADAPLNPSAYVTFISFNFNVDLPETQVGSGAEILIAIDNVTKEIEENLQLAANSPLPVQVTYRAYVKSDLTTPANLPPMTMTLKSATAGSKVEARAGFGDPANMKFPVDTYTTKRCPGLSR